MYIYKGVACMYICERLHSGMMLHCTSTLCFFPEPREHTCKVYSVAGKVLLRDAVSYRENVNHTSPLGARGQVLLKDSARAAIALRGCGISCNEGGHLGNNRWLPSLSLHRVPARQWNSTHPVQCTDGGMLAVLRNLQCVDPHIRPRAPPTFHCLENQA